MSGADSPGDAQLVSRALAGDENAFTQLMRRHKGSVYGFVRRYVGDADAALDVVQETFVAAWKALGRYETVRPFPTWLRAIALNKCRDRARRLGVRRIVFGEKNLDSLEAQRSADPAADGEAALAAGQRRRAVDAAIASLPAKLKEPLLLTYFEELSQQEAAALLGVSVKTVETRIYRARQRLAVLLGDTAD